MSTCICFFLVDRDCKQSTKEDVTAPESCDFVGFPVYIALLLF